MPLRSLLMINAALAGLHGLGFIFVPGAMLSLYNIADSVGARFIGQLFGAEMMVVTMITWMCHNMIEKRTLHAIVLANLVADIVATVVSFNAVLIGATGTMGWVMASIFALLTAGYLDAYLREDEGSVFST